jgi:hypothetical protein
MLSAAAGVGKPDGHPLFPWIAAEGAADSVLDVTGTLGIFTFCKRDATFSATPSNES